VITSESLGVGHLIRQLIIAVSKWPGGPPKAGLAYCVKNKLKTCHKFSQVRNSKKFISTHGSRLFHHFAFSCEKVTSCLVHFSFIGKNIHFSAAMSMSTILDSEATFEQQAAEAGLSDPWIDALKNHHMATFSKLSFAITTPGTTAQDADIRNFLGTIRPGLNPTIADLSAFKRILFEAQTLMIRNLKTVVKGDEGGIKRMAPPEREATSGSTANIVAWYRHYWAA